MNLKCLKIVVFLLNLDLVLGTSTMEEEVGVVSELEALVEELQKQMEQLQKFIMEVLPSGGDCDTLYTKGNRHDGVYPVYSNGSYVQVYCQFDYGGSGNNWMVIQRRNGGGIDFYRNWYNYTYGFGSKSGEFWIGLDFLHLATSSTPYKLRVDLEDWNGNTAYAEYSSFSVGGPDTNYQLEVSGYTGTAGDSISQISGNPFSTHDTDNDQWVRNCAEERHGAWWYKDCSFSNLNGKYLTDGSTSFTGVFWFYWKYTAYSVKKAEMKIRP